MDVRVVVLAALAILSIGTSAVAGSGSFVAESHERSQTAEPPLVPAIPGPLTTPPAATEPLQLPAPGALDKK